MNQVYGKGRWTRLNWNKKEKWEIIITSHIFHHLIINHLPSHKNPIKDRRHQSQYLKNAKVSLNIHNHLKIRERERWEMIWWLWNLSHLFFILSTTISSTISHNISSHLSHQDQSNHLMVEYKVILNNQHIYLMRWDGKWDGWWNGKWDDKLMILSLIIK